MSNTYADAYKQYLAEAKAAIQFRDPNWTEGALAREQFKRLTAARARLRDIAGGITATRGGDPAAARAAAFEQLAVTDANTAAVASNEWAKVNALLDAGRNLGMIIRNADQRRLAAILDHLDSDIAIRSEDPEGVVDEVATAVLSRLAELGNEKAQAAIAAQAASEHDRAWQSVIADTVGGAEVPISTRSALYRANPNDHELAFGDDVESKEVRAAIARLDQVAASLREDV